ncbi:probable family 17 glucosidase Scw4p [Monosporozyma unispora]|nr:putative 17 glucosidase scw10 [Kazachstania unispora]
MRLSNILTTSALLGSAIAAPAVHHQHQNKRDAVVTTTVRNDVTVVVNGADPATQATIAPVDESAFVNNDNTNQAQAAPATPATTTLNGNTEASAAPATTAATAAPATTASSAASASTASSSNNNNGDSASNVPAGDAKGITYSPYNADGSCKSAGDVASDLSKLTDYGIIRLYGVDCNQVENVLQAKTSSQKLFLGIFYVDQIQQGVATISSAINQYGSWNDVDTVSIGNELVNGGQANADQVGQYVSTGRSALQAAGYTGPVVSVDTFIAVINNPDLCQHSDYMAVNAHAYFDQNTAAEDAGSWVLQQIERVYSACGGSKNVVITESGWPTQGQTLGLAVPSQENQATAISSIKDKCGASTFLFTAFNDYWKADGPYGVEKYWGIYSN